MRLILILLFLLPALLFADELEPLFEQLAVTESTAEAAGIEAEIWAFWLKGPTDDATDTMELAVKAMNQGEWTLALVRLDQLIEQTPDFTEAWNKRATIHYMLGHFDQSIADIKQTLKREPRHFGAWSGLAMIMEHTGRLNAALQAHLMVLEIYPASISSQQRVEAIKTELLANST